jgi:hypothetical protein
MLFPLQSPPLGYSGAGSRSIPGTGALPDSSDDHKPMPVMSAPRGYWPPDHMMERLAAYANEHGAKALLLTPGREHGTAGDWDALRHSWRHLRGLTNVSPHFMSAPGRFVGRQIHLICAPPLASAASHVAAHKADLVRRASATRRRTGCRCRVPGAGCGDSVGILKIAAGAIGVFTSSLPAFPQAGRLTLAFGRAPRPRLERGTYRLGGGRSIH